MNPKGFILFIFGLWAVVSISPLITRSTAATTYTNVSVPTAKNMVDTDPSLVVLDVRNQSEYDTGHIRNAKLIPVWQLTGRLNELNQSSMILVYCQTGGRSATASQTLVDNGFANIYNMLGGVTDWISAGYPVYVNYSSAYAPYSSIQAAINNANDGNTIYVSSGLYYEHLKVDKSISLVGENKDNTIIDGTGNGTIFDVIANNVSVSDFAVQNCGCSCKGYYGFYVEKYCQNVSITNNNMAGQLGEISNAIKLDLVKNVLIEQNSITESDDYCILITNSSEVQLLENNIVNNWEPAQFKNCTEITFSGNNVTDMLTGISVLNCSNSIFLGNSFSSNDCGLSFSNSKDNLVFRNNFLNNQIQVSVSGSANSWDNGEEGNYWSNYTGTDANQDGIGDTAQILNANNTDHYPLMGMYNSFKAAYGPQVDLISNSTISNLDFQLLNSSYGYLKFNVTGDSGTQGFCRIGIPKALINGSYLITFDGGSINPRTLSSNDTYTCFYVSYTHSQHTIEITGTTTVPEFPTLMITTLVAACTLLVTVICRRKRINQ